MFAIPLLVVLLAQALFGSAYVVLEEEDGYYRTWRPNSNTFQQKQNPWSSYMNPQNYLNFLQNMNPFSWMWQAQQQSLMQENSALNVIYDRQKVLFNIMKCLVEDESKVMCRHLLGNAMPLFPESVQVSEIWITNANSPNLKPTEKPMDGETMIMISKPIEVEVQTIQIKPIEQGKPMMEMKPSIVQPQFPESKPGEIEIKVMEDKPLLVESVTEMKVIEPGTIEAKPIEKESALEATLKPIEDSEMKPAEIEIKKPIDEEMKPTEIEMKKPMEEIEIKPSEKEPAEMEIKKPLEESEMKLAEMEMKKPMEEEIMKPADTQHVEMEMKNPIEDNLKSTEAEPGVV